MKKRITYIDTAKGILILLMLIGHIWNNGFIHDFIYVFHMPAFFILAGMTSCRKEISLHGFAEYVVSRGWRLLIPYLCYEVCAIFADMMCNGIYLNVKGYAYQVLTLRLFNGPLWFLMVLFISNTVFYFLQGMKNQTVAYGFILAILAAVMVMPQYSAYISPSTVTLALCYMLLGCYFQIHFEKMSLGWAWPLLMLSITVLISLSDIGEMPDYQSGSRVRFLLGSICGTAFVLALSKWGDHVVFQFLGRNSLVILGSHYPIIRLVKHFFNFDEFSSLGGILFFVILVPFEILIILFVNRFLPFAAGKPILLQKTKREEVK